MADCPTQEAGLLRMEELLVLSSSQCENKGSILTHLPDFSRDAKNLVLLCETYRFLNAKQKQINKYAGQKLPMGCSYGLYLFIKNY